MFTFGLIVGALGAGALMYYIQPTVKLLVAKAFGSEPALIADYQAAAAKIQQGLVAARAAATAIKK